MEGWKKISEQKVLIKFIFPFISKSSHSVPMIITLAVSPRCKPGTEQMSLGALNMHSMQVKCEVEADPADSVKFHWTYNNTRNVSPVSIMHIICEAESHGINFHMAQQIDRMKEEKKRLNFIV